MKKTLSLILLLSLGVAVSAQADRHKLRDGNRHYKKEKYDQAEVSYRRALERDSLDYRGQFNLANTLYRQKKYADAVRHYDQALQTPEISDKQRAHAFHNKGNSFLKAGMENREQGIQQFQQAVNAYQEALKLDPKNNDTRYNLAYARRLLQQAQQQQQQGGGGQNNQNQDQQKQQQQQGQNQNQDQKQQNQQNQQGQSPQDQNQKDGQQRDTQKKPSKMDQRKQDAERLLEAVKNNERQTLKDQQKKVQVATGRHTDKDW